MRWVCTRWKYDTRIRCLEILTADLMQLVVSIDSLSNIHSRDWQKPRISSSYFYLERKLSSLVEAQDHLILNRRENRHCDKETTTITAIVRTLLHPYFSRSSSLWVVASITRRSGASSATTDTVDFQHEVSKWRSASKTVTYFWNPFATAFLSISRLLDLLLQKQNSDVGNTSFYMKLSHLQFVLENYANLYSIPAT